MKYQGITFVRLVQIRGVNFRNHLAIKYRILTSAIVKVLKPVYHRLGNRSLLDRCLSGFTQYANESLHNSVWRFCSKTLFQGRIGVEIG